MISQLLIASNLGVMAFFSVFVAPSIFNVLPAEWAAVYVRKFFPKYYSYLAAISLLASFLGNSLDIIVGTLICSSLFVLLTAVLTPKINEAKDSNNLKRFDFLHKLSVAINLVQMVIFTYLLLNTPYNFYPT